MNFAYIRLKGQRPVEQTHGSFEFKHTNPTACQHEWRKLEETYWSSRFKHTNSTVVSYNLKKCLGASSLNTQIPLYMCMDGGNSRKSIGALDLNTQIPL